MFLASQMQKEHSIEHWLSCLIVLLMVQFLRPKLLKQHKTNQEQCPLAPTSTANRSTLQPLYSITLFSGMYLLTLKLCQASMFSSNGEVNSMRITLFSLLEKIVMSGLSSVNATWGRKEKGRSRFTNKTQSGVWCNIPMEKEFLFSTLVPFLTNFIFMGWFEVGAVDLMFLMKVLMKYLMNHLIKYFNKISKLLGERSVISWWYIKRKKGLPA